MTGLKLACIVGLSSTAGVAALAQYEPSDVLSHAEAISKLGAVGLLGLIAVLALALAYWVLRQHLAKQQVICDRLGELVAKLSERPCIRSPHND